ncbi:MAG: baseplate J/gp47 family protein [Evtepia sp.]|uniref:baseplate J/gp47 family protein n=1 Tax=Evtepia sp. TaxID=2773933 RepID=UPI002A766AB1|nr:baseplate J/gp47 family protein [Evtepia sp.]MDY3014863.1 baseplate J/gp47 family protein [Evtepia sp.]
MPGGQETEGDEALRQRILDTYRRLPNGTNTAYYEREALAVEGVAAVGILPKARGVGTVDIIVAGPEGMPSDDLVQRVRSAMERKREIAVTVWVSPPEAVETDVTVMVTAQKGFAPLEVQKKTEETIRAWFSGERLGKDLLLAELGEQIFHVEGVANYHIRTPDQDLTVKEKQLPVLKTLRVEVFS